MSSENEGKSPVVEPVAGEGMSDIEALLEKLADAATPGFQAEFDPGEAERAGAFREDALSEADALESVFDLTDLG